MSHSQVPGEHEFCAVEWGGGCHYSTQYSTFNFICDFNFPLLYNLKNLHIPVIRTWTLKGRGGTLFCLP